jgi:hypothetical protein
MLRLDGRRARCACLLGVLFSTCALQCARGDEVEYLSDRPVVVFSLDMVAIFKSKLFQQAAELPGFDGTGMDDFIRGNFGIPIKNVARITGAGNGEGAILVFKSAKTISANDIKAARKWGPKHWFFKQQIGSHTIYSEPEHPFRFLDIHVPFCVVSDKVLLCGSSVKEIERSLQRKKKPEFGTNIQEGLDQAGFANTITLVVDLQAAAPWIKKEVKETQWLLNALDHFGTLTLRVNLGETNKISATMFCKDAAGAAAVRKLADEGLALWRAAVKGDPQDAPGVKEANNALSAFADAVKISTKGSRFEAEATLDVQSAVSVLRALNGPIRAAKTPTKKEK